jgi:hypothetical protein
MTDLGHEAPKTFVLYRGAFDRPKEEVAPGLMQILYPASPKLPPGSDKTSGRRTALADLLTDPQNPLPARVMVNRVWQHHFGQGIVATPSDFGLKGERPTHPELLDWLSDRFVREGWSLRSLHRLIVTSSTYRESSAYREAAALADPANKWFWRFPRQRLEGEVIRDASLAVAGLLNPKMGGPSIFPELPAGMPTPRGGWKVNATAEERNRRSIYVFVRRNTRYPMFDSFDMPDPHESCSRRNITTSPLQALTLLNSKQSMEWAQGLAGKVVAVAGVEPARQVEEAFRIAYGRLPDQAEQQRGLRFLREQQALLSDTSEREPADPKPSRPDLEPGEGAALVDFCHALLNANEFVYEN